MTFHAQITSEMDQIMEKKVSSTASEKWDELVPKVLKLAEAESNSQITTIMEELGDETDESMLYMYAVQYTLM